MDRIITALRTALGLGERKLPTAVYRVDGLRAVTLNGMFWTMADVERTLRNDEVDAVVAFGLEYRKDAGHIYGLRTRWSMAQMA